MVGHLHGGGPTGTLPVDPMGFSEGHPLIPRPCRRGSNSEPPGLEGFSPLCLGSENTGPSDLRKKETNKTNWTLQTYRTVSPSSPSQRVAVNPWLFWDVFFSFFAFSFNIFQSYINIYIYIYIRVRWVQTSPPKRAMTNLV